MIPFFSTWLTNGPLGCSLKIFNFFVTFRGLGGEWVFVNVLPKAIVEIWSPKEKDIIRMLYRYEYYKCIPKIYIFIHSCSVKTKIININHGKTFWLMHLTWQILHLCQFKVTHFTLDRISHIGFYSFLVAC